MSLEYKQTSPSVLWMRIIQHKGQSKFRLNFKFDNCYWNYDKIVAPSSLLQSTEFYLALRRKTPYYGLLVSAGSDSLDGQCVGMLGRENEYV